MTISWIEGLFQFYPIIFRIISFFIIIVLTWIFSKIFKRMIRDALHFSLPQFASQAGQSVYFFVWFVGILFAISQLGLSMDILLLFIALFGILFVISLREVFSNILSKPFLDLFYQYKIGEEIRIEKNVGRMIESNPLSIKLLTKQNEIIVVPNSLLLKKIFVLRPSSSEIRLTFPFEIKKRINERKIEKEIEKVWIDIKNEINWDFSPMVKFLKEDEKIKELFLNFNLKNSAKKNHILSIISERIKKIEKKLGT